MSDDLETFYTEIGKANEKAFSDIETSFSNLTKSTEKLDPIKLISQLTLTFLFVPENTFIEESSDTFERVRWIEFLTGYLLSKEYPKNPKTNVDGRDLENIEKLLDEYFRNIAVHLTTS